MWLIQMWPKFIEAGLLLKKNLGWKKLIFIPPAAGAVWLIGHLLGL